MRTILEVLIILVVMSLNNSCDDESNASGSPSFSAKASLSSSTLASSAGTALVGESNITCPSGSFCLTPSNVSGEVMSVGFIAGVRNGRNGYKINPIGPNDPSSAEAGSGEFEFSLATATTLSGEYACCEGSSYPTGEVVALKFELNFDYIDTTFTIPSGPLAGEHTIRIAYTDKTFSDGMVANKGDKLYKTDSAWKFCTDDECASAERSDSTHFDGIVQSRSGANPAYAYFSASIDEPFSFTKSEATEGNWAFGIDFDMGNGATFSSDPASLSSVADLVAAFSVNSKPGDGDSSGSGGFTVAATKARF